MADNTNQNQNIISLSENNANDFPNTTQDVDQNNSPVLDFSSNQRYEIMGILTANDKDVFKFIPTNDKFYQIEIVAPQNNQIELHTLDSNNSINDYYLANLLKSKIINTYVDNNNLSHTILEIASPSSPIYLQLSSPDTDVNYSLYVTQEDGYLTAPDGQGVDTTDFVTDTRIPPSIVLDSNNSASQSGQINLADFITEDKDFYSIDLTANTDYQFSVQFPTGNQLTLYLMDSNGNIINNSSFGTQDNNGITTINATYNVSSNGKYYLLLEGNGNTSFDYTINVSEANSSSNNNGNSNSNNNNNNSNNNVNPEEQGDIYPDFVDQAAQDPNLVTLDFVNDNVSTTIVPGVLNFKEKPYDIDLFKIIPEKNKIYDIELTYTENGAGPIVLNPNLALPYINTSHFYSGRNSNTNEVTEHYVFTFTGINENIDLNNLYIILENIDPAGGEDIKYNLVVREYTSLDELPYIISPDNDVPDMLAPNVQIPEITLSNGSGSIESKIDIDQSINKDGDRDIYKVNLKGGDVYEIKVTNLDNPSGTVPFIEVYDQERIYPKIVKGRDKNGSSIVSFKAPKDGIYYVYTYVFAENSFNYRMDINKVDSIPNDIGETVSTAKDIVFTDNQFVLDSNSAKIDWGDDKEIVKYWDQGIDADVFRLTVTQDDINNKVEYKFVLDTGGKDIRLETFNNHHLKVPRIEPNQLKYEQDGNKKIMYFTPDKSGDYYFEVYAFGQEIGSTYDFKVYKLVDDHPDSIDGNFGPDDTITLTNSNGTLTGSINVNLENPTDIDYVKLNTQAGYTYEITVTPKNTSVPIDPSQAPIADIYISNPNEVENIQHIYTAGDAVTKIFINSETDKDYYLFLDGAGVSSGEFTITVNAYQKGQDDHPDSINDNFSTDDIVQLNSGEFSGTGNINTSYDRDLFKLEASRSKTYEITLSTNNNDFWPSLDLDIKTSEGYEQNLLDELFQNNIPQEQVIHWGNIDYNNGERQKIYFTPYKDGTYYIDIGSWNTGDYTLTVKEVNNNDDHPNSIADTFTRNDIIDPSNDEVSLNGTKNTEFDQDVFKLKAESGKIYEIELLSGTNNFYPFANILNPDGSYSINVTYEWTGDHDKLILTPDVSGDYYIVVDGYGWDPNNNSPITTGDYTLKVKESDPSQDDHANSINEISDNDVIKLSNGSATVDAQFETSVDVDLFELDVKGNHFYKVVVERPNNNDTWLWAYADVLDENGKYLWESDKWDEIQWYWENNADNGFSVTDSFILMPQKDGKYYLRLDGDVGNYRVKVEEITIGQDDYPNSINTEFNENQVINIDTTTDITKNGHIGLYDTDYIKLSVDQNDINKPIEITLSSNSDNFYPYFDILDSDGNYVWQNIEWEWDNLNNGEVQKIKFTPTEVGDYYIEISEWQEGDYSINVKTLSTDNLNDTPANTKTSKLVSVGGSVQDRIDYPTDIDWIKVTLKEGKVYQIDVESTDIDVVSALYDSSGNFISYDDDGGEGGNARIYIKPEQTGDYYIEVGEFTGSEVGNYTVSVTEVNKSDNEAEDTSTNVSVNVGSSYSGKIDYVGDVDWISVNLSANKSYDIYLSGKELANSSTVTPALLDPEIVGIYDANGNKINGTSNDNMDDFTLDSYVRFTPQTDGEYYIAVKSHYIGDTGGYELSVIDSSNNQNTNPVDTEGNDINNVIDKAINIDSIANPVEGTINYSGDIDVYKVHLIGGKKYQIDMLGLSSDNGTLPDPKIIDVEDANGNSLVQGIDNNDNNLDSYVIFTPNKDGDYYIRVSSADDNVGTYNLKIKEIKDNVNIATSQKSDWTIMVYMSGDNSLEDAALENINEMEAANIPNGVNVTFLLDRAKGYTNAEGDWTDTKVGIVQHDTDELSISSPMEDWGEKNTGSKDTLKEFINWSIEKSPADHYMLVVWNSIDEDSGDDLDLGELVNAIKDSKLNKVDIIGLDVSMAGELEILNYLKTQTDYVIASPEVVSGDGWDYKNWLSNINGNNGNLTAENIGEAAINSYKDFYSQYPDKVTLAMYNLSNLDNVITNLKDFNDTLKNYSGNDINKIKTAISEAKSYGQFQEYIDIKDLFNKIASLANNNSALRTKANNLLAVIDDDNNSDDLVVYSASNDATFTPSVNIYLPGGEDPDYFTQSPFAIDTDLSYMNDFFYGA